MTVVLEKSVSPNKFFESHKFDNVNNFVEIYDTNILNLHEIIKHAESNKWKLPKVSGINGGHVDKRLRDSYIQNYTKDTDLISEHIVLLNHFSKCLNSYLQKYPMANEFPSFEVRDSYNVIKYEKGQAYHANHSDYFPQGDSILRNRHLTGICFLSDVSEGGELVFPQQNLEIKPEQGKLVIFPSGWTHAHHTMPVLSDDLRYVFQLWWSFE